MSDGSVLIVDDQPGIRLLLTEVLTAEGFSVKEATNGKEALDMIHNTSFDLVILDYKLPIIDGESVLKQMVKENINIPAIIMSGLVENITEEARNCGNVKAIIEKPFNIPEFSEKVKSLVM